MTIQRRRDSLFKSSISIRSINDSFQKFSEGIRSARKNSDEIIKSTRESNIFKRNLVRKDNLFFRRRQENVRRKAREDELEASSVQGVPKTQGTILAKSTRGFLGRMLDFLGILLIGWAVNNLPKIISGIQSLIKKISTVTGILGFFIESVKNVVMGIGTVIRETLSNVLKFDFLKDKKDIEEGMDKATQGLMSAQKELIQEGQAFQEADQFGLPEPPGFAVGEEEEKQQSRGEGVETDSEGQAKLSETPVVKEKLNEFAQDTEKEIKKEPEKEVVKGEADDIDSSKKLLEDSLTETDNTPPLPSAGMSGGGGGDTDVEDPRDVLKEKQKKVKEESQKKTTTTTDKSSFSGAPSNVESISQNKPVTSGKSSFLGTPTSVANINQNVTPKTTTLEPVNQYDPDFEGGKDGSRKVNLSSLVSPSKKEVNIKTDRKSKNKVMIIEKPVNVASSSVSMPKSKAPTDISNQVSDEKLLMKMQSTSTLKYT
tara:strand:+ start:1799 stop:3253 length:1455 start_codon:yes stop_codon:yes gene_type:complete